jgi:cytochrome P450
MLLSGGSTTSTAMSGVFFYLSRNPDAYLRVASEVRAAFSSGKDIVQGPRLSSCKYLHAVIEETMRMSPSTLSLGWREQDQASVAAGEDFIVDGHLIPPGTQVAVSQFALQHDETYFPEPYKFRPERWLILRDTDKGSTTDGAHTSQQNRPTAMRRAFAPFSVGDRGCAGKPMAWLEMRLAIAKTLWYFDFERAPGEAGRLGGGQVGGAEGREKVDEFQLYESIVVDHNGPNLVFTPRGEFWRDLEQSED